MTIIYNVDTQLWWPKYEKQPMRCFSFVNKGLTDMDLAIKLCKQRRVCVQAGGHVGLWPARLATIFERVHTFEAEPLLLACMQRNVKAQNIAMYGRALGAYVGEVRLRAGASAGSYNVHPDGEQAVQQTTVDALALKCCDALFFDVEAYEVEVLRGCKDTIARCRPVIHVEELPRSKAAIQRHMQSIGYVMRRAVHSDVIYSHE